MPLYSPARTRYSFTAPGPGMSFRPNYNTAEKCRACGKKYKSISPENPLCPVCLARAEAKKQQKGSK